MMQIDPTTLQAAREALVMGATLVGTETAKLVVRDAYNKVKALLQKEEPAPDLAPLETAGDVQAAQAAAAQLELSPAVLADQRVLVAINNLVVAIQENQPEAAETVGVDLGRLVDVTAEFGNITAEEGTTAVRIKAAKGGTLKFRDVGTTSKK